MPRFRINDLTIDLPLGSGQGEQSGGCGGVTNPCLLCTRSPTYAAAAEQGCALASHCVACTATPTLPIPPCGGCSNVTNPCLGCTTAPTFVQQAAVAAGGCGFTHAATTPPWCEFTWAPRAAAVAGTCGGFSHESYTYAHANINAAACLDATVRAGYTATPVSPCTGCTLSHTLPTWCPPITFAAERAVSPAVTRCLPWTIGPVCHGGFTHHPGLDPDPAALAALKEELRAKLRQVEEQEASGGLPSDPGQAAELEQRLQTALDAVRQHRARLEEKNQGGDGGARSEGKGHAEGHDG